MFRKNTNERENMKLLKYVQTDVEACVLQGLLESCGIYCIIEYDAEVPSSKVVIGATMLGVNIYVRNEDYEEAKMIIEESTIKQDI